MEGMSNSLFLDPFQDPFSASDPGPGGPAPDGPALPESSGETVPGSVVDSGAAADRADRTVAVFTPLDLVDAASAFLDDTHLWWPREFKATDRDGHVYFGEGQVLEEGTEGEIHLWGTVLGASDTTLEMEWLGRQPPVAGAPAGAVEGSRVFLSWTAADSGGTELTVRGTGAAPWVEEWETLLGALARFTGGRPLDPA